MTATATTPAAYVSFTTRTYELSPEKYQQMIEANVLTEEDKVELILGRLIEKILITSQHAATVRKLRRYFSQRFAEKYEITCENPITLPNNSRPEPGHLREWWY